MVDVATSANDDESEGAVRKVEGRKLSTSDQTSTLCVTHPTAVAFERNLN